MDASVISKWNNAKSILKRELQGPSYEAWFSGMELIELTDSEIVIEVPDLFAANNIRQRYMAMLENVVFISFGARREVKLYQRGAAPRREESSPKSCSLDPRYTFESFVVGQSNRFAHAACVAVAELPAEAYNPLFIYGGVGLGKTHLMHATGHYILNHNPGMKLLYITSEAFTNDLIQAIRQNTNQQLRTRLRSVDVLLIDDIQFIAGKDSTQEEFFHTFNHLRDNGKQIIISSDRPPKDIPTLEERLRSRFEWGLIADIQKPDYETRLAILSKRADAEGQNIDREVLEMIAQRVDSNIRELEGSLTRIIAMAQLSHERITLQMAETALNALNKPRDPRSVTPELVLSVVCNFTGISKDDILSKKRDRAIAQSRQYAMYLLREYTQLSTVRIGAEIGGRDHSTVMHACDKISDLVERDPDAKRDMASMRQKIEER